MGMYTGLKGRIRLNDSDAANALRFYFTEFEIKGTQYDYLWNNYDGCLTFIRDLLPKEVHQYCIGRSAWVLCSRSGDWMLSAYPDGDFLYPDDQYISDDDAVIYVSNAIKNYDNEIEKVITHILPHIAVAWDLLSTYEEVEFEGSRQKYQHNIEMLEGY